jgi:hypothetical protein
MTYTGPTFIMPQAAHVPPPPPFASQKPLLGLPPGTRTAMNSLGVHPQCIYSISVGLMPRLDASTMGAGATAVFSCACSL